MASPDLQESADGQTALRIPWGADLQFDVRWMAGGVQTNITAIDRAEVRDEGENVVLNLATYTAIAGGIAQVRVPKAVTALLDATGPWYWVFVATGGGASRVLLEGQAFLRLTAELP